MFKPQGGKERERKRNRQRGRKDRQRREVYTCKWGNIEGTRNKMGGSERRTERE